jgi:hypothetical protein
VADQIQNEAIARYQAAIAEAERFVRHAKVAVKKLERDKLAMFGSPETAQAKRASMDLTRSLARLRSRERWEVSRG